MPSYSVGKELTVVLETASVSELDLEKDLREKVTYLAQFSIFSTEERYYYKDLNIQENQIASRLRGYKTFFSCSTQLNRS